MQTVLGKPNKDVYIDPDKILVRAFIQGAAAATNIQPINVYGVQNIKPEAVKFEKEIKIKQWAGGERTLRFNPTYRLSIEMFKKDADSLLSQAHLFTFGASGYGAFPYAFDDVPRLNLEVYYRDNTLAHLGSEVFCDLVPDQYAPPLDNNVERVTVPFYARHVPFKLRAGLICAYDVFAGDGSWTTQTLSGTPASLFDMAIGERQAFYADKLIYIKEKLSTDEVADFVKAGYTLATTTLTSTAGAPALNQRVEVFYAKAE